jgi:uncharacterized SAM-dependent methyltransferase
MQTSSATQPNTFAEDVRRGLSSDPKFLSSKYFYDDEGSRLFQEIMKLPEYYLTESEFEIFSTQTKRIYDAFGASGGEFDLIELGAGDGVKTSVLVDYNLSDFSHYASYHPIEGAARSFLISRKVHTVSIKALNESFEFAAWEPIFMEISQKYNPAMIEDLARTSGFEIAENFFDRKNFYADSLWKPI